MITLSVAGKLLIPSGSRRKEILSQVPWSDSLLSCPVGAPGAEASKGRAPNPDGVRGSKFLFQL